MKNIAKIGPKIVKNRSFLDIEGKRPTPTPLPHMRLWFQFPIRFASSPYSLAQFFSAILWYLDWFEWHKH